MSPGGHLATTAAACAVTAAMTHSWPLTAGVAVGGFLIDVDHAIDYVLFEGQRDLRPAAFLRYYLEGRVGRAVLVLHSYELLALAGALAGWTACAPLWGYLIGALLHLSLDIAFNGELLPNNVLAFYSFGYRAVHRFRGSALHGSIERAAPPENFWHAFFKGSAIRDASPVPVVARPAPPAP